MDYLALCKAVRRKCGIQGEGPSSVVNQSGILKYVVDAVATAYQEVQTEYDAWNFMWDQFEFTTVDGTRDYDPTSMQIDRLAEQSLTCYDTTETESEEWRLIYQPYTVFAELFDLGIPESGKPEYITVLPDRSIRLFPTPDASTYTVKGDFYRVIDTLSANTDTPILPTKYHDAIIYKAMIDVGTHIGAAEVVQMGDAQLRATLRKMYRDETPTVQLRFRPLA